MAGWNYRHRIEYRRETGDSRTLEYVETVQDQGWCFTQQPALRQAWLTTYTRACAEDYLERRLARAGTFVVTVYQDREEGLVLVCAIRLKWPGAVRKPKRMPAHR